MQRYSIGIDFGTKSGRVVLVDVSSGELRATHTTEYPAGVMDSHLPSGETLGHDWALQDPRDYLHVIYNSIPRVLKASQVRAEQVIGIGIDFTSCTVVAIDAEGTPMCVHDEYRSRRHSWVKLWKHHAAVPEAQHVTETARRRNEKFLGRYGGVISSEWMIPKILQVVHEDKELYDATDRFIEAGDWVVGYLTGTLSGHVDGWKDIQARNAAGAGFKALWDGNGGYPSEDYFASLHPDFADVTRTKLRGSVVAPATRIGGLATDVARAIGLLPGTSVSAATIDAMATVPGVGVCEPGKLVLAMGTSTCHMLLSESQHFFPGITGVVKDGILPGYYGYEAGQAAVGDMFDWFVNHCIPSEMTQEADRSGLSIYQLLECQAATLRPGETGLLALDWWNGNRSVLADSRLTGLMVGFRLSTTPADMYRALIEASAYGTRRIIEQFESNGLLVNGVYAGGGLARSNRLLMQIYADVLGREIRVPKSDEVVALGSAMLGAVAAGKENGGHASIGQAVKHMAPREETLYLPQPQHHDVYDKLYEEYCRLHDYFGRGEDTVMHRLSKISSHNSD